MPSCTAAPRRRSPDAPCAGARCACPRAPESTDLRLDARVGYVRTAPLSISPSTPCTLRDRLGRRHESRGTGRSRVGPLQASTTAPGGATSGWHTHLEVFGHLVPVDDPADLQPDRVGAGQPAGGYGLGERCEQLFGGGQQLGAFAGPFGGQ